MLRRLSRRWRSSTTSRRRATRSWPTRRSRPWRPRRSITDYVLADDSGLECDALDGAPGVFSARYGGIPSSTEKNNAKLLQELERVGATTPQQRSARFRCVLVLAKEGEVWQLRRRVRRHDRARRQRARTASATIRFSSRRATRGPSASSTEKTKMNLSHRGAGAEEVRRVVQGESASERSSSQSISAAKG